MLETAMRMQCAGSASDSASEVVPVQSRPQREGSFPGLYATSLPDQLFQTSELALMTSQWANATTIVAVDLCRGGADQWAALAGADVENSSMGSCAVLSTHNGEACSLHRIQTLL